MTLKSARWFTGVLISVGVVCSLVLARGSVPLMLAFTLPWIGVGCVILPMLLPAGKRLAAFNHLLLALGVLIFVSSLVAEIIEDQLPGASPGWLSSRWIKVAGFLMIFVAGFTPKAPRTSHKDEV